MKELSFLPADSIRKYYRIALLPESELDGILDFASKTAADPVRTQTIVEAWEKYSRTDVSVYVPHAEILEKFGIDTGKVNLLLALSLIPQWEERMNREGIPLQYAHAAALRIGSLPRYFESEHPTCFGIRSRSLPFLLNYRDRDLFRIGRFDFIPLPLEDPLPFLFSSGKRLLAFCRPDWLLNFYGERVTVRTQETVMPDWKTSSENLSGFPVNLITGRAEIRWNSLSGKFQEITGKDAWGLFFHIPDGGKMTPELCTESFCDALAFFARYRSEKTVRLIFSNSWIFHPVWLHYLPESNMAALIRRGHLFPTISSGRDGLYFVFGREQGSPEEYRASNSLQNAMLRCWKETGTLKKSGFFLLPDEIPDK